MRVDFNLLAVLLYILSTRVGKLHAYVLLIHVHSSFVITHSFSLTVNDHRHIPLYSFFGDSRHNTPHTMLSGGLLASLVHTKFAGRSYALTFTWVFLRQYAECLIVKEVHGIFEEMWY
jgi:hypothetical protein